MTPDLTIKALGGAVSLGLCGWLVSVAVMQDRHERAMVAGGRCSKITEALYTPAPTATTTCSGNEVRHCSTRYYQPDPYMRSLWRCPDPANEGKPVEFWRRTAEEFGK